MSQPPTPQPPSTAPSSPSPGGGPPRKTLALGGLIAVILGVLVAFGVLRGRREAPVPPPAPAPPAAADAGRDAGPPPELAGSDPRVRQLVGLLSPLPELGQWLASTEDLVRRFATAVANLAEGESPRAALSFLAPPGSFQVVTRQGRTYVDPASYARYDTVARVITSLQTDTSVLTYRALKPLVDAAYQEISRPGQSFDETLATALKRLIDTPVPEGELEVVDTPGVNYTLAAPELEQLTAAQKHLLRMGPANARAVQAKLRELREALALPAAP